MPMLVGNHVACSKKKNVPIVCKNRIRTPHSKPCAHPPAGFLHIYPANFHGPQWSGPVDTQGGRWFTHREEGRALLPAAPCGLCWYCWHYFFLFFTPIRSSLWSGLLSVSQAMHGPPGKGEGIEGCEWGVGRGRGAVWPTLWLFQEHNLFMKSTVGHHQNTIRRTLYMTVSWPKTQCRDLKH